MSRRRHTRRARRPTYRTPLGIRDPAALAAHRELEYLRAAAGSSRGRVARRWRKLTRAERPR